MARITFAPQSMAPQPGPGAGLVSGLGAGLGQGITQGVDRRQRFDALLPTVRQLTGQDPQFEDETPANLDVIARARTQGLSDPRTGRQAAFLLGLQQRQFQQQQAMEHERQLMQGQGELGRSLLLAGLGPGQPGGQTPILAEGILPEGFTAGVDQRTPTGRMRAAIEGADPEALAGSMRQVAPLVQQAAEAQRGPSPEDQLRLVNQQLQAEGRALTNDLRRLDLERAKDEPDRRELEARSEQAIRRIARSRRILNDMMSAGLPPGGAELHQFARAMGLNPPPIPTGGDAEERRLALDQMRGQLVGMINDEFDRREEQAFEGRFGDADASGRAAESGAGASGDSAERDQRIRQRIQAERDQRIRQRIQDILTNQ